MKLSEISYGRFVLDTAKRIIAISNATRRFLIEKVGVDANRIEVIPTGVDVSRFSPETEVDPEILPPDLIGAKVILFVGRLVGYKGVDLLLRAFWKLAKKWPDARVCILGNGPEGAFLNHLSSKLGVADKVTWLSYVPNFVLPQLYTISKVFVLPSLVEPLGIVLLEAMASGKPIVATDVGGIPDLVLNGVNGILVKRNSTAELGNALDELIGDEELARRMGEEGRRLAEKRFAWRVISERILSVYGGM